jgi:oxygen-independent coproporphyrinogen-3 oxidase|nr:MAG: coproporphyrinogen III oxidase [Bacteroidota bacterium]
MAGIYVHIPFCRKACHYCDFHFSTSRDRQREMINAICRELVLQQDYLAQEPVHTLYFGGGTPSLLTADELHILLDTIRANYALQADAEITLEANPDDLSENTLSVLRQAGVNRLSIGVQSFSDAILESLNRNHDARQAVDAVRRSRAAGFTNVSIDLMYAIPDLSMALWEETITTAIALGPDHISAYTLTIEPRTYFGHLASKGTLIETDEETAAAQMERLADLLAAAGFEQYEVSNFAKPGFESRHNRAYWEHQHYLGVGPGAHSYNGVTRQWNISNNPLYIKAIRKGRVPFESETLQRADHINEYLLTSLRTSRGCDLERLRLDYAFDLRADRMTYLENLRNLGLATLHESTLQLTRKGRLLADKIAADLFVSPTEG